MMDLRAASRYARALLGLAEQDGQMEEVDQNLSGIRQILDKHPQVTHMVLNSTISLAEKEAFLDRIFGKGIASLSLHFLQLLVRKKRFLELAAIQESYHREFERKKGIREVVTVSARPLSEEAKKKLEGVLKKKLNSDIRMVPLEDSSMIGGLILRLEDREINYSYRDKLQEIRQKLIA